MKAYTFKEKNEFSKIGISVVCSYLNSISKTINVKNVEDDKNYQKNDIDLVWNYKKDNKELMISVEVKTDKYTTGNFWLETLSNKKLKTQGCFVKSKARYLFYYFTGWDSMYIIPLKRAKEWFIKNMGRFRESETSTKDESGTYSHTTVGRIVPINIMMNEVEGIKLVKNVSEKFNS
tara:strand:+ start:74 stop:604 length:531 start_codon:yes stop_codon:yes gene_type:complete